MDVSIKKILIAEDEQPMAKALVMKLSKAGFVATAVHNGEEALSALEKDAYAVLLLDLAMPGLDGFGVLEEIEKRGIHIPTIILSNLGQEEDVQRTKKYGVAGHFIKSDTPIIEVINQVKKILSDNAFGG